MHRNDGFFGEDALRMLTTIGTHADEPESGSEGSPAFGDACTTPAAATMRAEIR